MATLTSLSGISGLNIWYSTKGCEVQLHNSSNIQSWGRLFKYYPFSEPYHSSTMKQQRDIHWLRPTFPVPTYPSRYTNGSFQTNWYYLGSSPGTLRYTSEPSWWPIIQTNSYGTFAALRFTNKKYWEFTTNEHKPGSKNILQFIVAKRNGTNNSQYAGGDILSPNGFSDEETYQTLIGAWAQKYGLADYGQYVGYAITADTGANNSLLTAKYSPTFSSTPYIAKSSVSFPTTPSIICQYIFRGQLHGLRLNGQNLAHNNLPSNEANIPFPSTVTGQWSEHQKYSYLIGGQASQYTASAYARNQWAYYQWPIGTVNHAEQDVYEIVQCTKDTPYTTQDVLDIEEFLSNRWTIPVSKDPLPTSRPPSVFDVFRKGNEDGATRFKRLRMLGYV